MDKNKIENQISKDNNRLYNKSDGNKSVKMLHNKKDI